MQVFHVSSPSSVELPSSGSAATATDGGDGFSQVLARQQSEQSAGAAPSAASSGQPSGTTPSSPSADANSALSKAGPDGAVADAAGSQTNADSQVGRADGPSPASSSPLADMVRELTASSRAVAAGSLERSAAQAAVRAGAGADPAMTGLPGRTSRLARDGSATEDLATALDPASVRLAADGAAAEKSATEPRDEAAESQPFIEQATALAAPDVRARESIAALRSQSADAATPAARAMAGQIHLSGQGVPDTSSALTQAGSQRDLKPNLAADALAGRNTGLSARRGDSLALATEAGARSPDGKPLPGQAADSLFAGVLSGAQSGEVMPELNPVSAMAPAVTGMTPGMAPSASVLTGSIPVPLGSPQWAPAFSEQMVQIGTQQGGTLHHAELRLDPPDLGPLRVSITMQGDQATATFVSPHALVRSAVEAALPQLMQALADAGISLGNTSVGEQDAREFAAEDTRRGNGRDTSGTDDGHAPEQAVVQTRPRGLIDTFA